MIAKTVTSDALVLALQIAPALAKSVRVIGSWKIEDKRDPISGKPWIIAQAGGAGSWIQIRCEAVSDAGKGNLPFLVVGIGTRQSLNDGDKAEGKIKIDDNPAQSIVVVVINAQEGAG